MAAASAWTTKSTEDSQSTSHGAGNAGGPKAWGEFGFLAPMLNIHCGNDKSRDELQAQYGWLRELTMFDKPLKPVHMAFSGSRENFKHDGNLFMFALRRFVQADLRLELYYVFVGDNKHGDHNKHLLDLLHKRKDLILGINDPRDQPDSKTEPEKKVEHEKKAEHEKTDAPDAEQDHGDWASNMVKNRQNPGKNNSKRYYDHSYFELKKDEIFEEFEKEYPGSTVEFEDWLKGFNTRYWQVRGRDIDSISFSRKDMLCSWVSPQWIQIGRNLSELAQLLGIETPESLDVDKPIVNDTGAGSNTGKRQMISWYDFDKGIPNIIGAFSNAVKQQPTNLLQLQGFIQKQNITIQRQEQVITALRFRNLMEHLPGPKDNLKETGTARWKRFWTESLESTLENRTGPLFKLMEESLSYVDKQKNGSWGDKLKWLCKNAPETKRANALYGMLSSVIHNYKDGEFEINELTYHPDDIAILKCFIPDPGYIEKGEVKWDKMREEYLSGIKGTRDKGAANATEDRHNKIV